MTLLDRVEAHFRERPDQWIDARVLSQIGGFAAWRTRVSLLRKPPKNMHILNRQRRLKLADGRTVTKTEYCWMREGPPGGLTMSATGDVGAPPAANEHRTTTAKKGPDAD